MCRHWRHIFNIAEGDAIRLRKCHHDGVVVRRFYIDYLATSRRAIGHRLNYSRSRAVYLTATCCLHHPLIIRGCDRCTVVPGDILPEMDGQIGTSFVVSPTFGHSAIQIGFFQSNEWTHADNARILSSINAAGCRIDTDKRVEGCRVARGAGMDDNPTEAGSGRFLNVLGAYRPDYE